MSQASQLIDLVKQALRDRGRTYADLARGLGVSESSVKRLFSKKKLSLERLEEICGQLDLEIVDLLEMARSEGRMRRLAEDFDALAEEDGRALNRKGHWGTTMVIAIRPWELAVFSELRRPGVR